MRISSIIEYPNTTTHTSLHSFISQKSEGKLSSIHTMEKGSTLLDVCTQRE